MTFKEAIIKHPFRTIWRLFWFALTTVFVVAGAICISAAHFSIEEGDKFIKDIIK